MDTSLNIYISNSKPVELQTLSHSLNGLSFLYASFIERNNYNNDFEPKLFVKQIKDGSIDLYLVAGLAYNLLSSVTEIQPMIEFTKQLIELMKFFLGESLEKPKKYTLKEIKALIDSLEIISRDSKSNQKIQLKDNQGNIYQNCTFNVNSVEASAIQNNARKYIEEELQPIQEIFKDTTMYWADANFISDKQHGKVIIEEIDKKAKNVAFKNESDRLKCTTKNNIYPAVEWQNLLYNTISTN